MLIHVACPSCSEPYDIADTFAGGVYRCAKCNTLMSVPKKYTPPIGTQVAPGMGKAASPDEAESRGGASVSKNAAGKIPASRAPAGAGKPGAKPPLKSKAQGAPAGLAAYKWHFVSFGALILVALLVFAIVKLTKGGTKTEETVKAPEIARRPESPYAFNYAMGVLSNAKPNVLGLPLTGNVAVVVDGGSELNAVRPALHLLLAAGLTGKGTDKPSFTVVYANGEIGDKIPASTLAPVNAANGSAALNGFLKGVSLKNPKREDPVSLKNALQSAVNQTVANTTRHIVLVTGRSLTSYAQKQLLTVMEAGAINSTHFDLVVVDADTSEMGDLKDQVTSSKGRTLSVSTPAIQAASRTLN